MLRVNTPLRSVYTYCIIARLLQSCVMGSTPILSVKVSPLTKCFTLMETDKEGAKTVCINKSLEYRGKDIMPHNGAFAIARQ